MKKVIVLPPVTTTYNHLTEPNRKFIADGEWQACPILPKAEAKKYIEGIYADLADDIAAMAITHRFDPKTVKRAATPWSATEDGNGVVFKIKNRRICGSGEKQFEFTPKLQDRQCNPWTGGTIGHGSKLAVAFQPYAWYVKGELGISLRLCGAQVIECKAPASSFQFTPYEDEPQPAGTSLSMADFERELKATQKQFSH